MVILIKFLLKINFKKIFFTLFLQTNLIKIILFTCDLMDRFISGDLPCIDCPHVSEDVRNAVAKMFEQK